MDNTQTRYLVLSDGLFSVWQQALGGKPAWTDTRLGEKPSALLAILVTSPVPIGRLLICQLLWPEATEHNARNCLRQALFRIRRRMGVNSVVEANGGLTLATPNVHSELDPRVASARQEVRAALGKRPRLQLVSEADGAANAPELLWRSRVLAFLEDPAAQLGREALASAETAATVSAADPAPEPSARPATVPEAPAAVVQSRTTVDAPSRPSPDADLTPIPEGSRLLVLDLGPEPVASPREAACRVVRQLWELRGAMGVEPGHRETLVRCQGGARVTMEALWSAIEDLLAAIAEEGPVLIRVASPERWPRVVLRRLASALDRLRTSPLTLLGTGIQLPSSYDRTAPALDDLSAPDAGRDAPRTARG